MTPEAGLHLDKARQCLANAKVILGVDLANDAGRNAYLAAFHAAQALIFERTGKCSKTHQGVHSEFHRLAKTECASSGDSLLTFPNGVAVSGSCADDTRTYSVRTLPVTTPAVRFTRSVCRCLRDRQGQRRAPLGRRCARSRWTRVHPIEEAPNWEPNGVTRQVRFSEEPGTNGRMGERAWHRRETRRQTENTSISLSGGKNPAYSPTTVFLGTQGNRALPSVIPVSSPQFSRCRPVRRGMPLGGWAGGRA